MATEEINLKIPNGKQTLSLWGNPKNTERKHKVFRIVN